MSNFRKNKNKLNKDIFYSYLIEDARRTIPDGYPIIEDWMVSKELPKHIVQWDQKSTTEDKKEACLSFYCKDDNFTPVLNNPEKYVTSLKEYHSVIGMDASPYDKMPLVVQKNQIYINLALTYYYGKQGIKIFPNVRVGNNDTLNSLDAYPKNTFIAVGTNGFMHNKVNRLLFANQMKVVIDVLRPIGIIVYGPIYDIVFEEAIKKGIPVYPYDSFMMKRNEERKQNER